MDVFFFIFIFFTVFVVCSLCGFCCRNKEQGAIFSTPVVITSSSHQPAGGQHYEIPPGNTQMPPTQMPMPMPAAQTPYPNYPVSPAPGNAPYPPAGAMPYPAFNPTGPGGYPPTNSPYPPQSSAPYPDAMSNPPSYQQAVEGYQKQSPFNPAYSGPN